MTFNVYYSDRAQPDSSFINRAWYDDDSRVLSLELSGSIYKYEQVPSHVYHDLVEAYSPGTYYRQNIQGGNYSGRRLGPVTDLREVEVGKGGFANYDNVKVQDKTDPVQVFTSGNVTVKSDGALSVARVPLSVPAQKSNAPVEFDYTLHFVVLVNGEEGSERSHTLKASNFDEAIEQMFGLADLLDQDIVLKGASVRFD